MNRRVKKQDQRLLQGAMPEELVGNSSALSIPFILVSALESPSLQGETPGTGFCYTLSLI